MEYSLSKTIKRTHYKTVSYQSKCVEDVDEKGKNLTVEVRGDVGAEGGAEDDDGDAHGHVLPTLQLGSGVSHELSPVKSWNQFNC